MTHRTSSSDACSFVIMLGIAMFTIVRSSRVMKNPSETTMSTAHGFPRKVFTKISLPSGIASRAWAYASHAKRGTRQHRC